MTAVATGFLELFLATVQARPQQPAVCGCGGTSLSYLELAGRAASLGERLRAAGAGPEHVVGLCLDKSPDYVAALVGVWWAGAAFLPLAPGLPDERLAFLVRDGGVAWAFTTPDRAPFLQQLGVRPLVLEADQPRPLTSPSVPLATHPDELAYVIYTSGSTGKPKGVEVTHRGIVPFLQAQIKAFELGPGDRPLWFLSQQFDASVSDIGTALLSGATLVVAGDASLAGGVGLAQVLAEQGITHLDLPPALLPALDAARLPESLRVLILGGEPCPPELVRRWARRCRVVNVYGPTEATVCTSLCVCHPDHWEQPLLGQPIAEMTYRVLDDKRRPVSPGGSGELFIAGPGLARGYRSLPELTAQMFLRHDDSRCYRTGDHVRLRADGEYVFLGRMDRQVKVRGQLVEPEEVEANLRQHPCILHAAVVKRPLSGTRSGERPREGLVAFVVPQPTANLPPAVELQRFLAARLPAWMVPQRFEYRHDLPRTSSGKIDLAALCTLPLTRSALVAEPSSREEAILADTWRQALGLAAVQLDEGFFAQGGDSLALLQAVALAQAGGLSVSPSWLAEGYTIQQIAASLHDRRGEEVPPGARCCDDLRREADACSLGQEFLQAARRRPVREQAVLPRTVLLTGATGLLGSRLLMELLPRCPAEVSCLVRCEDAEQGRQRVEAALRRQELALSAEQHARLRIVPGDLEKPFCDLSTPIWDQLTETVEAVYHCAARVNLVLPYEALRATNVLGTREVVRFLGSGRPKRLHYASTLSVFVASDQNHGRLLESDTLEQTRWVYGGYAQTKWAAEWLLRATQGDAGPITCYRLGLITGDSQTGCAAPQDFLTLYVRGLAQLGCVPKSTGEELYLDITPVDYAAAALAHLSVQPAGPDLSTFHIANPQSLSLSRLIQAVEDDGIRLQRVSPRAWQERLACCNLSDPAVAAAALASCRGLPAQPEVFARFRTLDLFQATGVVFDLRNTEAALAGSGLACPAATPELLRRYLRRTFDRTRPADSRE